MGYSIMEEHFRGNVQAEWVDHNGHMNLAYYVLAFDLATDKFFQGFGLDQKYRDENQLSTFAGSVHVHYKSELHLGDEFEINCYLLGHDRKRIRHMNRMYRISGGEEVALMESLQLHVDLSARRVCEMPDELFSSLEKLQSVQGVIEIPPEIGRGIEKPAIEG